MEQTKIEEGLIKSIQRQEEMTKENIKKAESIGFKNTCDRIVVTDQYGFIKDEKVVQSEQLTEKEKELKQKRLLRENARLEKWNKMLVNFDEFVKTNHTKLKDRTRKGIPDSLRGLIWQLFAQIDTYRSDPKNTDIFARLVAEEESDATIESTILRDIDRTFPKHALFKDKYGLGQRSLFNVLRAYSKYNKETGYVQGMGFIAALMLTYMDDESTFWMIHSLMYKYHMIGYYFQDFPALKKTFYVFLSLMKKHVPKVYEHFRSKEVYPSMYASHWFITLFAGCLKFDILVRVFDVFLLEGPKVLYRFALVPFKINEERFLKSRSFEDILGKMKSIFDPITAEELLKVGFEFSISRKQIEEYEQTYEKNKGNTSDPMIKQVMF